MAGWPGGSSARQIHVVMPKDLPVGSTVQVAKNTLLNVTRSNVAHVRPMQQSSASTTLGHLATVAAKSQVVLPSQKTPVHPAGSSVLYKMVHVTENGVAKDILVPIQNANPLNVSKLQPLAPKSQLVSLVNQSPAPISTSKVGMLNQTVFPTNSTQVKANNPLNLATIVNPSPPPSAENSVGGSKQASCYVVLPEKQRPPGMHMENGAPQISSVVSPSVLGTIPNLSNLGSLEGKTIVIVTDKPQGQVPAAISSSMHVETSNTTVYTSQQTTPASSVPIMAIPSVASRSIVQPLPAASITQTTPLVVGNNNSICVTATSSRPIATPCTSSSNASTSSSDLVVDSSDSFLRIDSVFSLGSFPSSSKEDPPNVIEIKPINIQPNGDTENEDQGPLPQSGKETGQPETTHASDTDSVSEPSMDVSNASLDAESETVTSVLANDKCPGAEDCKVISANDLHAGPCIDSDTQQNKQSSEIVDIEPNQTLQTGVTGERNLISGANIDNKVEEDPLGGFGIGPELQCEIPESISVKHKHPHSESVETLSGQTNANSDMSSSRTSPVASESDGQNSEKDSSFESGPPLLEAIKDLSFDDRQSPLSVGPPQLDIMSNGGGTSPEYEVLAEWEEGEEDIDDDSSDSLRSNPLAVFDDSIADKIPVSSEKTAEAEEPEESDDKSSYSLIPKDIKYAAMDSKTCIKENKVSSNDNNILDIVKSCTVRLKKLKLKKWYNHRTGHVTVDLTKFKGWDRGPKSWRRKRQPNKKKQGKLSSVKKGFSADTKDLVINVIEGKVPKQASIPEPTASLLKSNGSDNKNVVIPTQIALNGVVYNINRILSDGKQKQIATPVSANSSSQTMVVKHMPVSQQNMSILIPTTQEPGSVQPKIAVSVENSGSVQRYAIVKNIAVGAQTLKHASVAKCSLSTASAMPKPGGTPANTSLLLRSEGGKVVIRNTGLPQFNMTPPYQTSSTPPNKLKVITPMHVSSNADGIAQIVSTGSNFSSAPNVKVVQSSSLLPAPVVEQGTTSTQTATAGSNTVPSVMRKQNLKTTQNIVTSTTSSVSKAASSTPTTSSLTTSGTNMTLITKANGQRVVVGNTGVNSGKYLLIKTNKGNFLAPIAGNSALLNAGNASQNITSIKDCVPLQGALNGAMVTPSGGGPNLLTRPVVASIGKSGPQARLLITPSNTATKTTTSNQRHTSPIAECGAPSSSTLPTSPILRSIMTPKKNKPPKTCDLDDTSCSIVSVKKRSVTARKSLPSAKADEGQGGAANPMVSDDYLPFLKIKEEPKDTYPQTISSVPNSSYTPLPVGISGLSSTNYQLFVTSNGTRKLVPTPGSSSLLDGSKPAKTPRLEEAVPDAAPTPPAPKKSSSDKIKALRKKMKEQQEELERVRKEMEERRKTSEDMDL